MKHAVIVHGWGATSNSNWFPWLKEELEQQSFQVSLPDFPNTQTPQLREWLEFFQKNVPIDKSTILIGHSLGVPFILRLLEKIANEEIVKASFLVSAFHRSLGIPETENFVSAPYDWEKIKRGCGRFIVINSDNDPYIPLKIGREVADKLDAELIVEHSGGHLSAPGGYLAYPRLRDLILNIAWKSNS